MREHWNQLNEREKRAVLIATVTISAYLFYLLIFSPLMKSVQELSQTLIEKKETLAFLEAASEKPHTNQTPQSVSNTNLLAIISRELREKTFQPFPYQLEQTGTGDIQIQFQRVPYTLFLTWLWNIEQGFIITVKEIQITNTDTPGVVKVILLITSQ